MKNADVKTRAIARAAEMIDFLVMETVHCDEIKHYQQKVYEQLKYDIETHGIDYVIDLLKKYRKEINELKQSQTSRKVYRASTGGE